MRRRLPAVLIAALLTFAVSACGDDSDDSDQASNDETTSQSDEPTSDDTGTPEGDDDGESPDDDNGNDDNGKKDDRDDKSDRDDRNDDDRDGDKDDKGEKDDDDNGAIPDDLESGEPDDPDDLPIDAAAVYDTCESVDKADTWPAIDSVSFDGGQSNVVATAEVKVKGGKTVKIVCDIAGPENNPQVMAYNPI